MSKKKFENLPVVNGYAAGIDVGSRSHYVAIGQDPEKDVCEFGVYSTDHQKMVDYLKEHQIKTIAMESTGSYWQSLFTKLQNEGFEVWLVSGHQTRNVRAKTDVKDCIWIQKLHSLGLLRGCFLPDTPTSRLRNLYRHRLFLIEESARMSNKMQAALRLMNFRLDVVVSDITGKTGIRILTAILEGETEGIKLAQLADARVKKSKEEIASALIGEVDQELLHELRDCYQLYLSYQEKIKVADEKIAGLLDGFTDNTVIESGTQITKKQTKGKNQPKFDLPALSYKLFGTDLFAIDCISSSTVLTLICEIGTGIYKFQSAKQFTSYLRLAPNNRVSGNKVISSRTPKGTNRLALALRNAANTIDRLKEGTLTSFFKRIAYKKGRGAAITATARKLAVIIWNMVVKKEPFNPIDNTLYQEMIKARKIASIKKTMQKMGITAQHLELDSGS